MLFPESWATLAPESLPATLDAPAIRVALEVSNMLFQNEAERQEYISRHIAELDAEALLAAPRIALQQGELIGEIRTIQKMMKLPQTPREELLRFSPLDLADRLALLEAQLPGT